MRNFFFGAEVTTPQSQTQQLNHLGKEAKNEEAFCRFVFVDVAGHGVRSGRQRGGLHLSRALAGQLRARHNNHRPLDTQRRPDDGKHLRAEHTVRQCDSFAGRKDPSALLLHQMRRLHHGCSPKTMHKDQWVEVYLPLINNCLWGWQDTSCPEFQVCCHPINSIRQRSIQTRELVDIGETDYWAPFFLFNAKFVTCALTR